MMAGTDMPLPAAGCFGKLPRHGDFVQRGLPAGFAPGWHAWLEEGLAAAEDAFGRAVLADGWRCLGIWRFHLPRSVPVGWATAGILAPGLDALGRVFPLTLLAAAPASRLPPASETWFVELEMLASEVLAGELDGDGLAARLPGPRPAGAGEHRTGWWSGDAALPAQSRLPLPALLRQTGITP